MPVRHRDRPAIRVVRDPAGRYAPGVPGCWRAELADRRALFAEALYPAEAVRKLLALLGQLGRSRWLPDYELV